MKRSIFPTFIFCSILSFSTSAAYNMKPGLWENSFTIKSKSGKVENSMSKMQENMAQMPAKQRKMIEEMMARQGVAMGGAPSSIKVCISKEQAQNLEIPQKNEGRCTHEVLKRTSNSVKMKFNCPGDPATKGEGEFTLISPTVFTGKTMVDTVKNGKSDHLDMTQKGKWLSADCGDLKPVEIKK